VNGVYNRGDMKEKDKTLRAGDRIEVYRNLHKDCFSVRKNGIVVKYINDDESLHLTDVKFVVQPAGHAKVLKEKRKNVHAYVRGIYAGDRMRESTRVARYNPYLCDSFITYSPFKGPSPIYKARSASLFRGKVYVTI
jgi:hypothetical protein